MCSIIDVHLYVQYCLVFLQTNPGCGAEKCSTSRRYFLSHNNSKGSKKDAPPILSVEGQGPDF